MIFQQSSAFRNDSWKIKKSFNEGQVFFLPHFGQDEDLYLPLQWGSPHLWTFKTWVATRLKVVRRIRPGLQRPWSVVIVTFKEFLQNFISLAMKLSPKIQLEFQVNLNFLSSKNPIILYYFVQKIRENKTFPRYLAELHFYFPRNIRKYFWRKIAKIMKIWILP